MTTEKITTEKSARSSTVLIPVFIPAVIVIGLLLVGTMSNPELAGEAFSSALAYITKSFGWFYMLSVAFFLIFIVSITFTKMRGKPRRLGRG